MREIYDARRTTARMRTAAAAFLENLSPEQKQRAMFPFEDEAERRNWDFIPKQGRLGLPFKDMTPHQQTLAHLLIAESVSTPTYAKIVSIMANENVLRELSKDRGLAISEWRSPWLYFVSFFGKPNPGQTWGWRIVGHHVSLNFTIADGIYLAPTPFLLGCEPSHYGVTRPLAPDEDLGLDLLHSLSDSQRQTAIIHSVSPVDLVTQVAERLGEEELGRLTGLAILDYSITEEDRQILKYVKSAPRGIAAASLNDEQRQKLMALVDCYVGRVPGDAGQKQWEKLERDGLDGIHFCWAGATELGQRHYYRIQAPSLLIEFDNSQMNGNHCHAVWRDPNNDFGDDVLMRHYVEEHMPPALEAAR